MSKPVFSDLFTLSGRRNRQSYFLYLLAYTVILGLIWGVAGISAAADKSVGLLIVAVVLTLAASVSAWIVAAQRCRDFGWTGWATLITLIPFVGWIFAIAIIFVPGTLGANRYGADPLGNSEQPVSIAPPEQPQEPRLTS